MLHAGCCRAAVGLMIAAGLVALPAGSRADDAALFKQLSDKVGPALVTVKFNLKIRLTGFAGLGGEQENENEITGVMVDPGGLVLCSNTSLGGVSRVARNVGLDMTATPSDLRVLAGDDNEGLEARLVARDSELDLAWIQIREPGERTFACIDLDASAKAELGQRLLAVERMGKYFDRAAVVSEARIGGITRKPRELYVPSSPLGSGGLPVFSEAGQLVGIVVTQMPDAGSSGGGPNVARALASAGDIARGVILPADRVASATRRAKELTPLEETQEAEEAGESDGE